MAIKIDGDCLSLEQFDQVARGEKRVELSPAAVVKIRKCRSVLEEFIHSDKPYYGINTGFGALAHPASVDNIPTSANQEDHVSMGTIGARQAREIIGNLTYILAIELMAAAQALDFYELKSSPPLENVKSLIRRQVPFLNEDTRMDVHIRHIAGLIESGQLLAAVEKTGLRLL